MIGSRADAHRDQPAASRSDRFASQQWCQDEADAASARGSLSAPFNNRVNVPAFGLGARIGVKRKQAFPVPVTASRYINAVASADPIEDFNVRDPIEIARECTAPAPASPTRPSRAVLRALPEFRTEVSSLRGSLGENRASEVADSLQSVQIARVKLYSEFLFQ
jgi:hypothetical protein